MKIAIDIGHNCDCDRGASGVRKSEDDLTLALGNKLLALLKQAKCEPIIVTPATAKSVSHSLRQRVVAANRAKADLFVSLHFNAFYGRAYGTEVYARSLSGFEYAKKVQAEICKLGFYDRGVKSANFYVLQKTKMPAILIECCFCDSIRDMNLYDANSMAISIKNGLIGVNGVYPQQESHQRVNFLRGLWIKGSTQNARSLETTSSQLRVLENQKLFVSQGVYTAMEIRPIEESHYYVKLKSGIEGFVYCEDMTVSFDK